MRLLTLLFCLISFELNAQSARNFKKLTRLFSGEYDNIAQTKRDTSASRIHIYITKVAVTWI